MDYKKMAEEIMPLVGGKQNMMSLMHCATRLRFTLKDGELFKPDELKKVKGVMGAMFTGGQYQIIIGTDVNHVYEELTKLTGIQGSKADAVEKEDLSGNKQGRMAMVMDVISSLFTPAIAAITGAAMIKVVLVILTMTGLMDKSGQTYQLFSIVCGIAGVKRIVFGPTGLTSIAIFIDPDNSMNFVFALVGVVVSFVATFVISYILIKKDKSILDEIGR